MSLLKSMISGGHTSPVRSGGVNPRGKYVTSQEREAVLLPGLLQLGKLLDGFDK